MKRLFDIAGSVFLLTVLAPLLVMVGLLVWWRIGRPVLFKQERPGRDGAPFPLYKFRTMTDERDADGQPLPDAERLPPFGRWLRSTSLDELPELWNILRGDMSFVGPRPLLVEYLPRYNDRQRRRHEVRPGLTGWAQVNGRNALDWPERLEMDVWYVENRTFALDLKILGMTVGAVLGRRGIQADDHATMKPFTGHES